MNIRPFFAALCLLLLLTGCAPAPAQPVTTSTPPVVAATLAPTFTLTPAPSFTPAATATQTASPMPSSTPTAAFTPTPDLLETVDPALFPETRRFTSVTNAYSLIPPDGWIFTPFQLLGGETDGWYPPGIEPNQINIGTIQITKGFELSQLQADWATNLKTTAPDFVEARADRLTTASGLEYLRWEITFSVENVPQRLVYAFYSSPNATLIVVYQRPQAEGSQYDRLADATFKTVRLNQ